MGLLKLVKGKKEARSGRMPGKEDRGHPLKEEVNMKKLSALLLALCLLFSIALAENVVELNWESLSAVADDIGGQWITIDDLGLAMWMSNGFEVVNEIPAEYADKKVTNMFVYKDEETGETTGTIIFEYVEVDSADVMEYVNAIEGASDAEAMIVNGLPCVNYDLKDEDATCIAFGTEKGNLFVISFLPASDEMFATEAMVMTASIQTAE